MVRLAHCSAVSFKAAEPTLGSSTLCASALRRLSRLAALTASTLTATGCAPWRSALYTCM